MFFMLNRNCGLIQPTEYSVMLSLHVVLAYRPVLLEVVVVVTEHNCDYVDALSASKIKPLLLAIGKDLIVLISSWASETTRGGVLVAA